MGVNWARSPPRRRRKLPDENTFLIDAVSTTNLQLKRCSNASQPFLNFCRWKTQIRAV